MTLWIQDHLVPGKDVYSAAETAQLALEFVVLQPQGMAYTYTTLFSYVKRHDDEIATLERTGVSVGRKVALQKLREQELAEFVGKGIGLWAQQERPAGAHDIYDKDLPDLRMASMVRVLRAWDGELNSLQKLDYAPFKQSMLHQ
jgi:hypothetical protein